MNIENILNEVGLTRNESLIYMTALHLGEQPASIISKRSALNRGTTYSVLKTLMKKGLITQSKRALGTYFQAKDPNYILNYLDNKKIQLDEKKEYLSKHINDILATKSETGDLKPQTTFYEGIEGIKQIHEDILTSENGSTIFSFIPKDMGEGVLEKFVLKNFVKRRTEKKIYAKVIMPDSETSNKIKLDDKKYLRQTKIVPKEKCSFESEITIYKKNIALISYKKEEMMGLIVESAAISSTLRQIFELTWNLNPNFILGQDELF